MGLCETRVEGEIYKKGNSKSIFGEKRKMNSGASFSATAPSFAGVNYGTWAVRMKAYLKAFDLWDYVDYGKEPTPLNDDPTMNQIKYFNEERAKGFRALTCIHNAVSEEIFSRILACETAKEAWDKLKAEFQGDEKSRKMQVMNLRRQFEGLKMKESESIIDFSSKISKLVNQVRLLGEDFPDSRIVEKVLVCLPEKFEHKICSLEDSKDFSEMSFQDLVNALQAVEQRQSYRNEGTSENALVAYKGKQQQSYNFSRTKQIGRKDKSKEWRPNHQNSSSWQPNNLTVKERKEYPACKYCKKTNHSDDWCWFKKVQCRNCNQFGHYQKYCKNRKEEVKQAQEEESLAVKDEHLFVATMHNMLRKPEETNSVWLIDSGCTNHMTADLSIFCSLDKSYKSRVKIGNGDFVKVEGKGAIAVDTRAGTKTLHDVLYVPNINQNLVSVGQLLESGYSLFF